tara:strand:+ start:463 stop:1161 length:699 start_codon:yes stop_codon:yes gene_type:complete
MPLPEIVTPTYELEVPSSKKKFKYRPFLVKEQKILILALESNDTKQIIAAIEQIFKNCIKTRFKMSDLSIFDVEYIFLQLRGRSVQETIEIEVPCDDDPDVKVPVSFPVDDVKVHFPEGHEQNVKISEDITVVMKYPNMEYFAKVNFIEEEPDPFELVSTCIDRVFQGENDCGSFTSEEVKAWLESLTSDAFDKIQQFFETIPVLKHEVTVTNPNTGKKTTAQIEGLVNFFG